MSATAASGAIAGKRNETEAKEGAPGNRRAFFFAAEVPAPWLNGILRQFNKLNGGCQGRSAAHYPTRRIGIASTARKESNDA